MLDTVHIAVYPPTFREDHPQGCQRFGEATCSPDPDDPPDGEAPGSAGPALGTIILVVHSLGSVTVPADLERAGFEVLIVPDPEAAIVAAASGRADLAVVDGRLSGDGLSFCERLWKRCPGFPVLVVGPNDEDFATRALAAGADDYLALPLRPAEFVARVRAVLRRVPSQRAGSPAEVEEVLQVGEVRLRPASHDVMLRDVQLHLPLREFELLQLLMENAGIVLSRATLLSRLWGGSAQLESSSLEVHIRRLRAKLEDDPAHPERIVTVRGIGYRFQIPR
ncbi:MAG TPA: response regulator transcription factor [Acidimicrobiales bacterium]|nr:response regulator transcription factor [Acidimicrobiales bacterium]